MIRMICWTLGMGAGAVAARITINEVKRYQAVHGSIVGNVKRKLGFHAAK